MNNQEIYTMEMDAEPSGCAIGDPDAFYPPNSPFCLRFNSGPNTVGVHDSVLPETLPAHLEIEYARVYKPVGEKASPITLFSGTEGQMYITENSMESSQTILKANYYPDADYSWSSPAFEIAPYDFPDFQPQHHSGKVKIWIKPGIQGGREYPVILNTALLSHEEQDTAWFFVCTEVPPVPQNTFQASLKEGPLCLYEILHPLENPSTSGCEFFDEATQTWNEAPIRIIGATRYAMYGTFDPLTHVPILSVR